MTETPRTLVEQDPTIGRVAETALRMMSGSVSPRTLRDVHDLLKRSPDAYPWQQVCDLVMAESADPTALVNKAIIAQRDWVQRGGRGVATSTARPKKLASNSVKRLLALLIVRGGFYLVFAVIFLVILVLVRSRWPALDIYQIGESITTFVTGLIG